MFVNPSVSEVLCTTIVEVHSSVNRIGWCVCMICMCAYIWGMYVGVGGMGVYIYMYVTTSVEVLSGISMIGWGVWYVKCMCMYLCMYIYKGL